MTFNMKVYLRSVIFDAEKGGVDSYLYAFNQQLSLKSQNTIFPSFIAMSRPGDPNVHLGLPQEIFEHILSYVLFPKINTSILEYRLVNRSWSEALPHLIFSNIKIGWQRHTLIKQLKWVLTNPGYVQLVEAVHIQWLAVEEGFGDYLPRTMFESLLDAVEDKPLRIKLNYELLEPYNLP